MEELNKKQAKGEGKLVDLISEKIKFNKKTVTIPISSWNLIKVIISKVKIDVVKKG